MSRLQIRKECIFGIINFLKKNTALFLTAGVFLSQHLVFKCQSQDIHFSQFNSSPFNLNPALNGAFNGMYRVVGNERAQWASVTVPYKTYGLSADARNFLNTKLNTGISLYTDRAGDSQFGKTEMQFCIAYPLILSADSSQRLAFGIMPNMTQQKMNFSKLKFDNQYNGKEYDPTLSNNENFSRTSRFYFNAAFGTLWNLKMAERKIISAGISMYNLVKPKQSFFEDNSIKLDRRLNFHLASQILLSEKIDLLPSFLFMKQGKFSEIDLGASVKYILNAQEFRYTAIYFGLWTRAKDSGFLTLGVDYNNWNAGLSYDLNYSKLQPASNGRGGMEISLIYIIKYMSPKREMYKICPDYI